MACVIKTNATSVATISDTKISLFSDIEPMVLSDTEAMVIGDASISLHMLFIVHPRKFLVIPVLGLSVDD